MTKSFSDKVHRIAEIVLASGDWLGDCIAEMRRCRDDLSDILTWGNYAQKVDVEIVLVCTRHAFSRQGLFDIYVFLFEST